ncbi:MAG: hypothetical protein ABI132_03965 [Rhodanobacteraceae bacterium]
MTTLHTRCSAQTKSQFHALAASHGVSASMLLRQMIVAVLAQNGGMVSALLRSETRGGRGGCGGQLRLRLRAAEIQAIRTLAEPEGYSAQAWIIRQLRHRLEDAVPFAKEELNELREALRETGALGRNLNKLLHILQRSDRFLEGLLDLKTLSTAVERLRHAVMDTMTRATHRGHRDGT